MGAYFEGEPSPFPKIKIVDVRAILRRCVSFCPLEAPDYLSEHYRGAEAMLVAVEPTITQESLFNANLSGFGYGED